MSQFLVTALQLVSFIVWSGFIVAYHVMSSGDWRRTRTGRNIMGMAGAFALILFLSLLRSVFGIYPGRDALLIFAYLWSAYIGVRRIQILEHESHRRGVVSTGASPIHPGARLDPLDPVPDHEDV